jgi:hypothetical protein
MRAMSIAAVSIVAIALSACATTGERSTWAQELDALTEECAARGGILSPIPGAPNPEARASFTCEIRGGASRLN